MSRAHLYRLLQDSQGNLITNATITVCIGGTTTPLAVPMWPNDTTTDPTKALTNPIISANGVIEFYLDNQQRICLQVNTPNSATQIYDNIDVIDVLNTTGPPGPQGSAGPQGLPGGVTTVVGQTGAVTGSQIVADPAIKTFVDGEMATRFAPLAMEGQLPSQDPVPDASSASAGVLGIAARADHVHPLSVGGGGQISLPTPWPPKWAYDVHLDGSTTVFPRPPTWLQGSSSQPPNGSFTWPLSGTTYAANDNGVYGLIYARNFTLDAGLTLTVPQASSGANNDQFGLCIVATGTITINGTIIADGANASGATAGIGGYQNWEARWCGGNGAAGGTGAGAVGTAPASAFGGAGGAGGASGATAGGASATYNNLVLDETRGVLGQMFLISKDNNVANYFGNGGAGGSAGAGDGTHAGGGGGAGGGCILLIAPTIIIGSAAVISAQGGNGGVGTGGNAGGGGGGGCGFIGMHTYSLQIAAGATLRNAPGNGGAAAGTGTAGSQGGFHASLNSYQTMGQYGALTDAPVAQGGYGYGYGIVLRQWQ